MPSLITWLSGGFETGQAKGANMAEAQAAAAHALLSMVTNNEPLQALIARSNGIQPLIELLSMDVAATQAAAARLLWHLAGNQESGAAIAAAGGMAPLCTMLNAEAINLQVRLAPGPTCPCAPRHLHAAPSMSYSPTLCAPQRKS